MFSQNGRESFADGGHHGHTLLFSGKGTIELRIPRGVDEIDQSVRADGIESFGSRADVVVHRRSYRNAACEYQHGRVLGAKL